MQGKNLAPMLAVLYGVAFLAGFSENLMNMALVAIMDEFHVTSVTAQWLVTGYMIVSTVMVTLAAFLYRRIPLRKLFALAAALFTVGTVAGYLAPSFEVLLLARLVQSAGSGIFIPMMMNTVLAVTPKNKLGSYMAIGGCMITFGPALAPVICGGVVTALGWRFVFVVPLVALVILGIGAALFLTNLQNNAARLDVLSLALSAVGLTILSYGLAQVSLDAVSGAIALVVAVAVLALFVVRQFKAAHPLIDLTPMTQKSFWPATILVLVAMMSTFSTTVLLPLYLEGAMGLTAAIAGLVILVPVLVNAGVSLISGRLLDKHGEWPLLPLGFVFIAVGFAILGASASLMEVVAVIGGSLLVFICVGMTLTPAQTAGLRTLAPEMNPFGVCIMTTFVQMAACVGPALFTGLMSAGQDGALASGAAQNMAAAQGFSLAMWVAAAIGLVAVVVAVVYSRQRVAARAAAKAHVASAPESALPLPGIMTPNPYVVQASQPVRDAMALMVQHHLGGLPVVGADGKLAGYVSDGDIMRCLSDRHPLITGTYSVIAAVGNGPFDERLADLMTLPVSEIAMGKAVSVSVSSSLQDVCTLLSQRKFKKLPVVDGDKVVGTVNRSDVIRYAMREALQQA